MGLVFIVVSRLSGLVLPRSTKYLMDDTCWQKHGDVKMVLIAVSFRYWCKKLYHTSSPRFSKCGGSTTILRSKVQRQVLRLPIRFFDNKCVAPSSVWVGLDDSAGAECATRLVPIGNWWGVLTRYLPSYLFRCFPRRLCTCSRNHLGLISLKAFSKIRPIFRERGKITADVTGRPHRDVEWC